MNKSKRILTLDDLYNFYSKKKSSASFSADKTGFNISVQTAGIFNKDATDDSEGLLYGSIKAFHDLSNMNHSYIDTDVLKQRASTMKDRPIMADIIEIEDSDGNTVKDFNLHTMEFDDENDKIVYIEKPVGHFINPDSFKVEYDETYERNFVIADCVIYEEYSDACDILRRRKSVDCSVELSIRDMAWDAEKKVLVLKDFYVQGCTLLGEHIKPGMAGSKLTLKDFAEINNSVFYNSCTDDNLKLINAINTVIEQLNTFQLKKEDNPMKNTENNFAEETLEENAEIFADTSKDNEKEDDKETVDETVDTTDTTDTTDEEDEVEEDEVKSTNKKKCKNQLDNKTYSISFEISHDEVRCGLYKILRAKNEGEEYLDVWIINVYDSYFIYESYNDSCKYFKQGYEISDSDEISFVGESTEVFTEYITKEEKDALNEMRANYNAIVNKLNKYEEADEIADKMTVFQDEAYSAYLNTDEFKSLMDKTSLKKFSKEELIDKADAALGKVVKKTKSFALDNTDTEQKATEKKNSFFAFARQDSHASFLDGLLNK